MDDADLEAWVRRLDLHQLRWCRTTLVKQRDGLEERVKHAEYGDRTFQSRLARTRQTLHLIEQHIKQKVGKS